LTQLGLAVGTVARSYRELETAGLVRSRRGGGTRVQATSGPVDPGRTAAALRESAESFVQQARLVGATDVEIRAAIEEMLRR
jgi:DNA-binding transcriptional regulator YhcF (GntR family)